MTAYQLLCDLADLGIKLSTHGDQLLVQAPRGALTDALKNRISCVKPELLGPAARWSK